MSRKLHTTLGYYSPAFFRIFVGSNKSFKKFTDKDYSVFLHEYIHFIQDTTSYYGLNNMYTQSEYIRFATNNVYISPDKKFDFPILPNVENKGNIYLNKLICNLTFGDYSDIRNIESIKTIEIVKESLGVKNALINEIESVYVTILDDKGKESIVIFGALSIMENMAYIIEQSLVPNYIHSPDFPYSFAEILVNKIFPEFGEDRLNILALCDLCLIYSNPGKVFVQVLNEIASNNWIPNSPEEVYDKYLFRESILNGISIVDLERNYFELSEIVKEQVKGYFNDLESFKHIRDWIDHILNAARDLRFKQKYFILDIARGGKITENKAFEDVRGLIGTPLISNSVGECIEFNHKYPRGVDLEFFSAIEQIISFFEKGNNNCLLYPICLRNGLQVDNYCKTAPWERCEFHQKCPFTIMWNHWNLRTYKPKNNCC